MTSSQPLVLIADDDRNLVDALALRCIKFGLKVERAHDGLSALTKINDLHPHFVILDVKMPGGSGLSVLEIMIGNEHLRSIPVVILTGQKDIETMRRCHDLLAYFVPKCRDVWPRIEPLLIEFFGHSALDRWVTQ
jgi:CheY-like chemotaxis protein